MVWVVIRTRDDMPILTRTLGSLAAQDLPHRLLVVDNGSRDGSREAAAAVAQRVLDVPRDEYVPGRVLNQAMRATTGEVVIFLNSDCPLQRPDSLRVLLTGLKPGVVACFGRQIPRPDCHALHARDTEHTFGDGSRQARWRHCFSMAFSAVRRSAWEERPFDETLAYSEDIDWTWRCRLAGGQVAYVPQAVVEHSHNYTLAQSYRRHFGEGQAEARIFAWSPWERCLLRFTVLPFVRQLVSDARWCLARGGLRGLAWSPLLRGAQGLGRRAGFLAGLRRAR